MDYHRTQLERDQATAVARGLEMEIQKLQTEQQSLRSEYQSLQTEQQSLRSEYQSLQAEQQSLRSEYQSLQAEHQSAISTYQRAVDAGRRMAIQLEDSLCANAQDQDINKALTSALESERRGRAEILNSHSWRMTAPLRKVLDLLLNLRQT
jgi:chromosome segregation ATPase